MPVLPKQLGSFAKITALAGIVSTIAFVGLDKSYTICKSKNDCTHLTSQEYKEVKTAVAQKIETNTPLSQEDFYLLLSILNQRAKSDGRLQIVDINNQADLKSRLVQTLYE